VEDAAIFCKTILQIFKRIVKEILAPVTVFVHVDQNKRSLLCMLTNVTVSFIKILFISGEKMLDSARLRDRINSDL
jgi:hypothetical protein